MVLFGDLVGSLFLFEILISALALAGHVLLALAVYYDGKSLGNKDSALWAVLVGLLGLLPGIIYLCIRKNSSSAPPVQQCCVSCRQLLAPGTVYCPYCGAPQPAGAAFAAGGPSAAESARFAGRAKLLLIIGSILLILSVVMTVTFIAGVVMNLFRSIPFPDLL